MHYLAASSCRRIFLLRNVFLFLLLLRSMDCGIRRRLFLNDFRFSYTIHSSLVQLIFVHWSGLKIISSILSSLFPIHPYTRSEVIHNFSELDMVLAHFSASKGKLYNSTRIPHFHRWNFWLGNVRQKPLEQTSTLKWNQENASLKSTSSSHAKAWAHFSTERRLLWQFSSHCFNRFPLKMSATIFLFQRIDYW